MKEEPMLSLQTYGDQLELRCREESTPDSQSCSAVWGGKGLTTSAVWGGRVESWDKKSTKSTVDVSTLLAWDSSTVE